MMCVAPIAVTSCCPEDTRRVAAAVAELTRAGDVILLDGDLGAGKTTFTQGFARHLGVEGPVTSPTFTLLRSYPTCAGFELYHADLYRLEQIAEVIDLGLAEILEERAAAVVEWGAKGAPALGPAHLGVQISFGERAEERRLEMVSRGGAWDDRWKALEERLG